MLIKGTVGNRKRNNKNDVKTVQILLNILIPERPLLVVDGLFGSKSEKRILRFQKSRKYPTNGIIGDNKKEQEVLESVAPYTVNHNFLAILYTNASYKRVGSFTDGIIDAMIEYDINTSLRQAHFLSQIGHESAELRYTEEIASGSAYEGRRDLGNTHTGDGMRFKGRGLIQLTGRANYTKYAKQQDNMSILSTPEVIATDPYLAVDVAGWFWNNRNLNSYADNDDVRKVTRRINGGYNGLNDRIRLLDRTKYLFSI